jgi:hypothetical protein
VVWNQPSMDLTEQNMRGTMQPSKFVKGRKRMTVYSGLMLMKEEYCLFVLTRQDFSGNVEVSYAAALQVRAPRSRLEFFVLH